MDVDLSIITENTQLLKKKAGTGEFMAVVKADGYGVGAVEVAEAAIAGGATWLGVARIDEGMKLRGAGIEEPILVLYEPEPTVRNVNEIGYAGMTPVVYTNEFIKMYADRNPMGSEVHLNVDTGMGREGAHLMDALTLASEIRSLGLVLEGVMTHLACAETSRSFTADQFELFDSVFEAVAGQTTLGHVLNTEGVLRYSTHSYDMVRCGKGLLGLAGAEYGLKQAVSLRSKLALVTWHSAGSSVGYNKVHVMQKDGYIGVVPVGYADGVPRSLAGVGWVKIGDWKFPIVSVCMDMLMVDLGRFVMPVGEPVELMGRGIPVSEWVGWLRGCGYNEYEIACGMGRRGRRYEDGKYSGDTAVT